jgi:hypothetical protein
LETTVAVAELYGIAMVGIAFASSHIRQKDFAQLKGD